MATNPIMNLLNVEWPEAHKANWNLDFDLATTFDVGYVVPILTDKIMANTHVRLNFGSALFTNPTIAPLYAKYKHQILAFYAPTALYVEKMRNGTKWDAQTDAIYPMIAFQDVNPGVDAISEATGANYEYVPTASLGHYLGLYPARFSAANWTDDLTSVPPRDAIPLLMYYDIYRNFIANQQVETFPVRTRAFSPSYIQTNQDGSQVITSSRQPVDTYISRTDVDSWLTSIRSLQDPGLGAGGQIRDVNVIFEGIMGFDPIFSRKAVFLANKQATPEDWKPEDFVFAEDYNYGLLRAPYASDYFSSFVSNENVEYERSTAKVTVQGNQFTMEQFKLASRMQNFIRKTIFKNTDFAEFIDVHFGVKPSRMLDKPMFLGSRAEDVYFNDVISTAQTVQVDNPDNTIDSNQNLGSRAAFGRAKLQATDDWFVEFFAKEPGYLMLLSTIIPDVSYFEGLDPMFATTRFSEEFFPEFDAIGWQDKRKSVYNAVPNSDATGVFIQSGLNFADYDTALFQEPAWFEHMAKYNRLSGQMTDASLYRHWTLARSFNNYPQYGDNVELDTTYAYDPYIRPEMFNGIFAVTQNVHNFQCYISFDYKKRQPLSKQFLSF